MIRFLPFVQIKSGVGFPSSSKQYKVTVPEVSTSIKDGERWSDPSIRGGTKQIHQIKSSSYLTEIIKLYLEHED